MGQSASSPDPERTLSVPRGGVEGVGEDGTCPWILVKAKTRQHNSTKIIRKVLWFEAKDGSTVKIGRGDSCEMKVEDDRCSKLNAVLESSNQAVIVNPVSRMYHLVGMGNKRQGGRTKIQIGSVVKVGSVSLEVTDMCTEETDDFAQRFAAEIKLDPVEKTTLERSNDSTGGSNESDGSEDNLGSGHETELELENSLLVTGEDVDDDMCYICWGGVETTNSDKEEMNTEASNNPLIQNPCGKCSGSSKYVHLNCLLTWIKSSGSGHCSICNGALPQHFSSPPPNIELKVVRHRRGQSWVGTRRYRLSFAERNYALIGRDSEADVRLGDRSVGSVHAKITYDKATSEFYLSDCSSLGGTFVQVKGTVPLVPDDPLYFKMGRTLLSMRMTHRKSTLLNMIQKPLSWNKR